MIPRLKDEPALGHQGRFKDFQLFGLDEVGGDGFYMAARPAHRGPVLRPTGPQAEKHAYGEQSYVYAAIHQPLFRIDLNHAAVY